MANNQPPDGGSKILPLDHDRVIACYQRAGCRPGDNFCPRCLEEEAVAHRKVGAIRCDANCILCRKSGHKGKACPLMMAYLGEAWLDERWPDYKTPPTDEFVSTLRQSFAEARVREGHGRGRGGPRGRGFSRDGYGHIYQNREDALSEPPSKKRRREDGEPQLADRSDVDPATSPARALLQLHIRAAKAKKAKATQDAVVMSKDTPQSQVEHLQDKVALLSKALERSKQEVEHLRKDVEARQSHNDTLEVQRDTLSAKFYRATQENDTLRTDLESLTRNQSSASGTITQRTAERDAAVSHVSKLQVQVDALQKQNATFRAMIEGRSPPGDHQRPPKVESPAPGREIGPAIKQEEEEEEEEHEVPPRTGLF